VEAFLLGDPMPKPLGESGTTDRTHIRRGLLSHGGSVILENNDHLCRNGDHFRAASCVGGVWGD
jgi:hypothetical protein